MKEQKKEVITLTVMTEVNLQFILYAMFSTSLY